MRQKLISVFVVLLAFSISIFITFVVLEQNKPSTQLDIDKNIPVLTIISNERHCFSKHDCVDFMILKDLKTGKRIIISSSVTSGSPQSMVTLD